jgi:hypothetical protein
MAGSLSLFVQLQSIGLLLLVSTELVGAIGWDEASVRVEAHARDFWV